MAKKLYICKQCKKRWSYPWTPKQLGITGDDYSYKEVYLSPHRRFFLLTQELKTTSMSVVDGKWTEVLDPEKTELWKKYPNLKDLDPDDFQNEIPEFYQSYLLRHHRSMKSVGSGRRDVCGSFMQSYDCGPILLTEIDDYQDQLEHFIGIEIK
jgi:hypothetical protein